MERAPKILSAETLIGDNVRNPEGEDLGKIEELMIDVGRGCIAYAVLSFNGFLGIGDKLFAIPWESLTVDTDEEVFILDVDKETLKDAPGFERDEWPTAMSGSDEWLVSIYRYYHHTPYWK